MDLLSEFNSTYNYLFGTLPSDTVATPHNVSTLSDSQFNAAATAAAPTVLPRLVQNNGGSTAPGLGALLSPISDNGRKNNQKNARGNADKGNTRSDSDYGSSADEKVGNDSTSESGASESDTDSASSEAQREKERRREEEERKAAEQRSRRREQLKQQVAFERMKERHRRQVVSPKSGPKTIARWQQDASMSAVIGSGFGSGNDTFPSVQSAIAQDALHASSGTINRGYMAGVIQHSASNQGYAVPGGGLAAHGLYSNTLANASLPNIGANFQDAQFAANQTLAHGTPLSPQRLPAMDPSLAANYSHVSGQQIQQVNGAYYMALGAVSGPLSPQQVSSVATPLPPASVQQGPPAYPVKLASVVKKPKNLYLSDSSEDDNETSSLSGSDSNTGSNTDSIDFEYDAPDAAAARSDKAGSKAANPARVATDCGESGFTSSDSGVIDVSRKGSRVMLADDDRTDDRTVVRDSSSSDALSDLSSNSQSSSKRQVRFNET
ncbi:hypothetical protein FBU59_004601, partial [Linderina macrospora]